MKFSFEFDAPKYVYFKKPESRRSTITDINKMSKNDRWFTECRQDRETWNSFFQNY